MVVLWARFENCWPSGHCLFAFDFLGRLVVCGLGSVMRATPGLRIRSPSTQTVRSTLHFATFSASADRRSEDVRVLPVVVTELELGNVQRKIFLADLVEGADHAAFDDRPEAFNGVGVGCADDVLTVRVVDDAMAE